MTSQQMNEIGRLAAHYGRYPGLTTGWYECGDGSVNVQFGYLVPADASDTEGTFPESQLHILTTDGVDIAVR